MEDEMSRRWDYLAEGNARQARKRVSAKVLIRDEAGRVLLVDPSYKEDWDLPGGMAEANESPRAAAEREVREELGTGITAGRPLVVDWVGPHGPWDDQLVFIFDGGILNADQADMLSITDNELVGFAFVPPTEACQRLRVDVGQRLNRALDVLTKNVTDYHEHR
jgi:8-oxo-dGTP pyrophosphatase MutT (NUDIX family)